MTLSSKTYNSLDVTFPVQSGATSVKIQQSSDGGSTWVDAVTTAALSSASTSATVTGLLPGTSYKFRLVLNGDFKGEEPSVINSLAITGKAAIAYINAANGTAKSSLNLPSTLSVTLEDSSTSNLDVNWDNGVSVSDGISAYNGNIAGTYTFTGTLDLPVVITNPHNLKAAVNVIVGAPVVIPPVPPVVPPSSDTDKETTPAAVRIVGTTKAGNTLSAELLDNNDDPCTTSAAVTYQWYRLNNQNDGFSNVIGNGKTYTLTDADAGKYIGLSAKLNGKSFIVLSGQILANTTNNNSNNNTSNNSNGNSDSTSSNHHSTTKTDDRAAATEGGNQANGSANNPIVATDGWNQSGGKLEYLKNGKPVTGWQNVNSKWYFMKDNGAMAKGWQEVNGIWYLLKDDGSMAIGWQDTDGQWYYLYSDGAMAKSTSVDGYNVGDDGAWIQ